MTLEQFMWRAIYNGRDRHGWGRAKPLGELWLLWKWRRWHSLDDGMFIEGDPNNRTKGILS